MHKIKVIVAGRLVVSGSGMAAILNSAEKLEVVGTEGFSVLDEAFLLQPDLILYVMYSDDKSEYDLLKKLKDLCGWTKIMVFTPIPVKTDTLVKLLDICDVYLQGPMLPGFLLRAVELAYYSGYFYLGSPREARSESAVLYPVK